MSTIWTLLSFMVYAALLPDANPVACFCFCAAWLGTYRVQLVLLQHVLLWLLMHLEAVKALLYIPQRGV